MDKMKLAQIREQLHEFIDAADESALTLLYAIMHGEDDYTLTPEQQRLLQLTVKEHQDGRSKSYTWAEARAIIERRE